MSIGKKLPEGKVYGVSFYFQEDKKEHDRQAN